MRLKLLLTKRFWLGSALFFLTGLVVVEWQLRRENRFPPFRFYVTDNRYVPRRLRPNLTVTATADQKVLPELESTINFSSNEFGFRSRKPMTLAKAPHHLRVAFIGGSTTECAYIDDKSTWPAVTADLVQAHTPGQIVEGLNFGVSGSNTRDHLALWQQYALPFQPDVLVIMAGINDLILHISPDYNPLRQDERSLLTAADWFIDRNILDSVQLMRGLFFWKGGHLRWGDRGPEVAYRLAPGAAERRKRYQALPLRRLQPQDHLPYPEFEQNLRSLIGSAIANDVAVILVTQSWMYSDQMREADLRKFWSAEKIFKYSQADLDQALRKFNEVTKKIGRELQVPLVDLGEKLPRISPYFYDEMHFSGAGAKQVAQLIEPAVTAQLREKKRLRGTLASKY